MFATGSHDGAVRIWTKPTHAQSGDDGNSELMYGDDTPVRTTTPSSELFDTIGHYRTESPAAHSGNEEDSPGEAGPRSRESRSVAFVTQLQPDERT